MSENSKIVELWNTTELSATQMRKHFPHLSREAILGRIWRARRRAREENTAPVVCRRVWKGNFSVRVISMPDAARAVLALDDDQCRWPVGNPEDGQFHFCRHTRTPGQSYCPHHQQRALRPPKVKT
ncbi:MAG: hypothetical protein E6R03_01055 [Hyphomicrobiaceae bacterium]|nr:MAG: hypothetical protein E6R03_01055 [Hyphomicrobiaceae bacterium]